MAPVLKHGRGKPLTSQTKEVLYCLYKYFENECNNNPSSIMTPTQLVAKSTGISIASVRKVVSESKCRPSDQEVTFKSPKKKPNRKPTIVIDNFDQQVIRRTIHDFHITNKEIPTLKTLHAKLKEDIDYKGCVSTLRKHVMSLGFNWKQTEDNRKLLMEKHEIRYLRINYLMKIAEYREQRRPIVYTDETYIHTSHTLSKSWSDGSTSGLKQHISKGNRLIIVHAGGMDGFIPNALLMFKANQKSGDYHDNMNYDNYSRWIQTQLIPNLQPNSVVVVDNAPYHNSIQNPAPNSNSRKQQMIDWLTLRNIEHSSTLLKPQLYELILQNKARFVEYKIDEILRQHGHTVLRLPPYHPEFNPIENIWGIVKTYVAKKNVAMNMKVIMSLAEEKMNAITVEEWRKVCLHAIEEENKYQGRDAALDTISERIIINLNNSSDESEDGDDCDMPGVDELLE
ncbi:uncharacterized protein LOC125061772 [Pieris napi]|uniref:Tc1-like transposase DDE domain-containing protein n=2 Tax=Pieris macdunnoughi TaxID=345717 RepID=A0A821TN84_9NEOP|nr:uncharacterized protein LOC125054645 [Pieris napi]XP_047519027.1 uncharacterized protein LOC125058929 [Pieris napi]XP_047522924.1 uncharacterized protein LOC125061495 [Pieris napi]XP_047523327.1 uncharacterized protein LOC125061772 [Pieris napi]CAF4878539.1 unnamed protein product [Pieris macdunnoughi]